MVGLGRQREKAEIGCQSVTGRRDPALRERIQPLWKGQGSAGAVPLDEVPATSETKISEERGPADCCWYF